MTLLWWFAGVYLLAVIAFVLFLAGADDPTEDD